MKKRILVLGMPALALVFMSFIAGCASWPTEGPSGFLTITGIPAENEGKRALANLCVYNEGTVLSYYEEIVRGNPAVIKNGELKLPLYDEKSGYFGSDTFFIRLKVEDRGENIERQGHDAGTDAIFESVKFENGIAELKWDAQVTPGFITLINVPPDSLGYLEDAWVTIGPKLKEGRGLLLSSATDGAIAFSMKLVSDTATEKFFERDENLNYRSFPQSGTRDVVVRLPVTALQPQPKGPPKEGMARIYLRFTAAPIQDGKITLDLSKGVKQ